MIFTAALCSLSFKKKSWRVSDSLTDFVLLNQFLFSFVLLIKQKEKRKHVRITQNMVQDEIKRSSWRLRVVWGARLISDQVTKTLLFSFSFQLLVSSLLGCVLVSDRCFLKQQVPLPSIHLLQTDTVNITAALTPGPNDLSETQPARLETEQLFSRERNENNLEPKHRLLLPDVFFHFTSRTHSL